MIKIAVSDEEKNKKDRINEYQRQYYQKNKEKINEKRKEYQRQYRKEHKEKFKEYKRQYYEKHGEKEREYAKRYYENHKEERKEYKKRYIQEHRSEINKRRRGETPPKVFNSLIKPIGSEKLNSRGEVLVKVNENNKWKLKHHIAYESYYGVKVGRWDKVIFLDGNRQNFNPKNLVKLSTGEQFCLAKEKMLSDDVELNKAAINIAKLIVATTNRKN